MDKTEKGFKYIYPVIFLLGLLAGVGGKCLFDADGGTLRIEGGEIEEYLITG